MRMLIKKWYTLAKSLKERGIKKGDEKYGLGA
jgi:hypothetical protein